MTLPWLRTGNVETPAKRFLERKVLLKLFWPSLLNMISAKVFNCLIDQSFFDLKINQSVFLDLADKKSLNRRYQ